MKALHPVNNLLGNRTHEFLSGSSIVMLLLIFSADITFFAIRIIQLFSSFMDHPMYDLRMDGSYPEFYQYLKFFWIAILFIFLSIRRREKSFLVWVALFFYIVLDDALQFHETVGERIDTRLGLLFQNFESTHMGELIFLAYVGAVAVPLIIAAYIFGSQIFRKISLDLGVLMSLLIFFGVIFDFFHSLINPTSVEFNFLLGFIEDAGEMVIGSLIIWYTFVVATKIGVLDSYLTDLILAPISPVIQALRNRNESKAPFDRYEEDSTGLVKEPTSSTSIVTESPSPK